MGLPGDLLAGLGTERNGAEAEQRIQTDPGRHKQQEPRVAKRGAKRLRRQACRLGIIAKKSGPPVALEHKAHRSAMAPEIAADAPIIGSTAPKCVAKCAI